MPDDVKAIELWPCRYDAPCKVRNCRASATTIARSVDSGAGHDSSMSCARCTSSRLRSGSGVGGAKWLGGVNHKHDC
jgi:hypothetical protein